MKLLSLCELSITTVVSESSKGFDVRVKVLQGTLRKRRRVGIALLQGVFEVKKIAKADGTMCDNLPAGEEASVLLVDLLSRSVEEVRLREGLVLFKGPPFPAVCTKFKASILTFSPLVPPIIPGTTFELYLHGEEVSTVPLFMLYLLIACAYSTYVAYERYTAWRLQKVGRFYGVCLNTDLKLCCR